MTPTYMDRANGMGRGPCSLITWSRSVIRPLMYVQSAIHKPILTMNREWIPDSCADHVYVDSAALFCLQNLYLPQHIPRRAFIVFTSMSVCIYVFNIFNVFWENSPNITNCIITDHLIMSLSHNPLFNMSESLSRCMFFFTDHMIITPSSCYLGYYRIP